jgi:hypothetical protein
MYVGMYVCRYVGIKFTPSMSTILLYYYTIILLYYYTTILLTIKPTFYVIINY